ncbi:hypothetical protein ACFLUO_03665 [Chloroflexota bacterium]
MTTVEEKKEAMETKELTFRCKYCDRDKQLCDMTILTRFSPSLVLCRDCERKIR